MYTPPELERMPKQFERYMKDLEHRVMEDIVARIKKNKEITSTADWTMLRISELNGFEIDTRKYIKETLNLTDNEVEDLFQNAIASGYARDEKLYKATGKEFIPFKDNRDLQQSIQSVMLQAKDELKNITNTLGFAIKLNNKLAFTPMSEYFSGILDGAMIDITSGAFDYNKTISRVIAEMTNSGLRTVDYASGWSNRVEVAARRAVMTGVGQITGKIAEQNAQKLETEYYEVSWHGTARPSHQEWQGKVYTMEELQSVCGYGTVGGLCGANCRHSFYPFIPGVSERTYTDKQLAEMNAQENKPKKYFGKDYTSYEATQRMRQMEAQMRAYRERSKLLEKAGVDEETLLNTKCKYQAVSQNYTSFAKAMELPQERSRVYGDGLGKISNTYIAKRTKDDIIRAEIKKLGFTGDIHLIPKKLDTEKLTFDSKHINKERNHNVSFEDAISYIKNAKISEAVWNGKFERYYSEIGVAYVDVNKMKIRTAYNEYEFTDSINTLMEVIARHGKQ